MDQVSIKAVLHQHKLRITEVRVEVLSFFVRRKKALSFKELEKEFSKSDRVTLYRTLGSFEEKGVLHKIPDDSGHVTYGLCQDSCDAHAHHHDHIHFKCSRCGMIECIDQSIPQISLPGYKVEESNLILTGSCRDCEKI